MLTCSLPSNPARLTLIGACLTALAVLSTAAQAQDEDKYGFVNISQVITQTEEGRAEARELQSLGSEKEQELDARRRELERLAAQYQESVESGVPDNELRQRVETLRRELERDLRQAQSDVDLSRQDRIQELGVKVVQVIQQFAKENGYTAIFRIDNGHTAYVAPGVDITDQIIAAYNKAHPVGE